MCLTWDKPYAYPATKEGGAVDAAFMNKLRECGCECEDVMSASLGIFPVVVTFPVVECRPAGLEGSSRQAKSTFFLFDH